MKSRVSEGPGVKSLTYPKVKPNVTFCLCWRSSGAEQLPCKQWVGGSNPVSRSRSRVGAHVAQSAERVLGKDEVSGSIPDMGSRIHRRFRRVPRRPAARTALTLIATANGRA